MPKSKEVFLVRHCETVNNVNNDHFLDFFSSLLHFKWPSVNPIPALINYTYDCNITDRGKSQIKDIASILDKENFWQDHHPDVVYHSQLKRAKYTCLQLLESSSKFQSEKAKVIELKELNEATVWEHIVHNSLDSRIAELERCLQQIPDEQTKIMLVGHGVHFRRMTKYASEINNCDVLTAKVTINEPDSSSPGGRVCTWSDVRLLYRTPLSGRQSQATGGLDATATASEDEERVCRICLMSAAETPGVRMISPCRCTGSQSHVHLRCFNRWRETSEAAHRKCDICKYEYRTESDAWVDAVFKNDTVVVICTIAVLLFSYHTVGRTLRLASLVYLGADPAEWVLQFVGHSSFWGNCALLEGLLVQYRALTADQAVALGTLGSNSIAVNVELLGRVTSSFEVAEYVLLCRQPALGNFALELVLGACLTTGAGGALTLFNDCRSLLQNVLRRGWRMDDIQQLSVQRMIYFFILVSSQGKSSVVEKT